MRKLSFLLVAIMGLVLLMPSCKDDEEILGPPTIDFKTGSEFVSADATIATNSIFKVGITAAANTESNKNLVSLRLIRTMDNTAFVDTSITINETLYNADFTFNSQGDGQVEVILFTITDDAGKVASKSLTITYEAQGTAVSKNADISLGSYNDDRGSFYSTINKLVYSVGDASNIQADIDFIFFLAATNGSSIASPVDKVSQQVFPAVAHWSTKNETLFATTELSVADFDAIADNYEFSDFVGDQSSLTQLESGDVIGFLTVNNKQGFIKINSINDRGDFVNIDVIVEE